MCGIAGIVSPAGPIDSGRTRIARMLASIRHRGPDGEGTFIDRAQRVALAHARLAVIDVSPCGQQPMFLQPTTGRISRADEGADGTEGGRLAITFNGEIYNFQALRAELVRAGESFETGTDTEVILRLFAREGTDSLRRLRGMFAFAIWDERDDALFLARDLFGIKPLYYRADPGEFLFASEVRSILTVQRMRREMDPDGARSYLQSGSVAEPLTIAEGIREIPPGHWARLDRRGLVLRSFAQLDFPRSEPSPSEAIKVTAQALRDSIEAHFVSDVPVGILLSGGIDSAGILALAAEAGRADINTFTIGFSQSSHDESRIARRIARHYGAHHTTLILDGKSALDLFHEYLCCIDQPSVDGFNTFVVCRLARQRGMKVLLSGLGGDELFGGYQSFSRIPKMVAFSRTLGAPKSAKRAVVAAVAGSLPFRQAQRVGRFLRGPCDAAGAFEAVRSIFLPGEASAIEALFLAAVQPVEVLPDLRPGPDLRWPLPDQVSFLELRRYMLNQLLRDSDAMSMASGVELRVPLVDADLFAAICRIPSSIRLAPGKRLLTDAIGVLPGWFLHRPKKGFSFPFARWLTKEWSEAMAPPENFPGVDLGDWYRRWCVTVLTDWARRNSMLQRPVS